MGTKTPEEHPTQLPLSCSSSPLALQPPRLHPPPPASKSHRGNCQQSHRCPHRPRPPCLSHIRPRPRITSPRRGLGAAPRCTTIRNPGLTAWGGRSVSPGTPGTRIPGTTRAHPPQNGSPLPNAGRSTRPRWTVTPCPTRPRGGRKRMTTTKPTGHPCGRCMRTSRTARAPGW